MITIKIKKFTELILVDPKSNYKLKLLGNVPEINIEEFFRVRV
jgi:hypothetical protein